MKQHQDKRHWRQMVEERAAAESNAPPGWKWCCRCEEVKPPVEMDRGNPGWCVQCRRAYVRATYARSEQARGQMMNSCFKRRYGITKAEYDAMLVSQGGLCAICGEPETSQRKNGKPILLSVDHSHGGGHVRKLLCHGCNVGLGGFGESISRLEAAIQYLRDHEKRPSE